VTRVIVLEPVRATDDEEAFVDAAAPGYDGDGEVPRAIFEQTRTFLLDHPRPDPWGSYLAREGEDAVGICAFKTAPDVNGFVEIAYGTFPAYQGRGIAKQLIDLLSRMAFAAGARTVTARTLPEYNPSNSALRRQGFAYAGEAIDLEDGLVWEWHLAASD
jgi:ribosomal-protein-alanine N-acetyltransferase